MAERIGDFEQRGARLRHVAGGRMPQIMKSKILDAGILEGITPGLGHAVGLRGPQARPKNQVDILGGLFRAELGQLVEHLWQQDQGAGVAVLGFAVVAGLVLADACLAHVEVDVAPAQGQEFATPGAQ